MDSTSKQNSQEDLNNVTEDSTGDSSQSSEDTEGYSNEDQNSSSPCGAEVESQAFRLRAAALRRNLVAMEERLQREESSRDRAEENIKEQVCSSQALLQTLVPLCEQKQQTMELIQRLQKALEALPAAMMRMSTRSESLGTIKEEQRVTGEVEALLQHEENMRMIYIKEHTALTELLESLEEEKPSPDTDDFSQQVPGSPYYMLWGQGALGTGVVDVAGLNRRNVWRGAGRNATQPALHRLINSSAWMEFNETSLMNRYKDVALPPMEEPEEEVNKDLSRLTRLRNKLVAFIRAVRTRDHPVSRMVRSFPAMVRDRSSWEWWTPLVLAVLLASLLTLLGTLTLQPAVEDAPAGNANPTRSGSGRNFQH